MVNRTRESLLAGLLGNMKRRMTLFSTHKECVITMYDVITCYDAQRPNSLQHIDDTSRVYGMASPPNTFVESSSNHHPDIVIDISVETAIRGIPISHSPISPTNSSLISPTMHLDNSLISAILSDS